MNNLITVEKEYVWFTESYNDPKWNLQGKTSAMTPYMPNECKEEVEKLKSLYGEPPVDFDWGYSL